MNRRRHASHSLVAALLIVGALIVLNGEAVAAQLTLSWTDASADETGFSIERRVGTTGTFSEVATTGPNVTTYVDDDLVSGTTYCYRMRAFNSAGYSAGYSNTACRVAQDAISLGVLKAGIGSGSVTSTPAGIVCGASCSGTYPSGTAVTLTAFAQAGSTFAGWSGGGCSGTGPCRVSLSGATTVTASFDAQPPTSTTDAFERPNSTVLGNGWTKVSGNLRIVDGTLQNHAQKARHLAVQEAFVMPAGRVTAKFTLVNGGGPSFGLVFGYRDPLNYFAAYRRVGGSSVMRIVRVVGGVEQVIATRPCPNAKLGKTFQLTVSFGADGIELGSSGNTLTASGVAVDAGGVGLMMETARVQAADDFSAVP